MGPAVLALIGPIVSKVLGLFEQSQRNEMEKEKLELELQRLLADQFKETASLLEGQIEINKREAEAGRLGWRNWLGIAATIAFIYGVLGMPMIESLLALLTLFGLPPEAVIQVKQLLPVFDYRLVFELLLGLLGLYGLRGWEKSKYSKHRLEFNKTKFYAALRKKGGLSQSQVDRLEDALDEVLKNN